MQLAEWKKSFDNGLSKYYSIFGQYSKYLLVIAMGLALFSMSFKLGVGVNHPKFITEAVKVFFNFIALNVAILSTIKNVFFLDKRKTIYSELFLTLIICALTFNIIVEYNPQLNQLVYWLYPTPLMTAILDEAAAIPWAFVVVGINLIISVILSLTSVKKITGINKMIHNGLLVYSVLAVALWFATHFSYVGSNYIYIANNMKIIDSIVDNHINNKMPLPNTFNIKVYDNYYNFKKETIAITQKEFIEDKKINPDLKGSQEIVLLNDWFDKIEKSNFGHKLQPEMSISQVKDFTNWVFLVLNFAQIRITPDKWIISDLVFPPKVSSRSTLIKHGLFYVKVNEGKLYTYVEFNKTFKEKQQNLIFNLFYSLFHFVYWILFLYLISHHQKRVFKKKEVKA